MGGLLAQMLAARCDVRAIACLAPSAPYGIMPSTHFEIASAQAMFFAGDFWNQVIKPDKWIAQQNSLDLLPPAERDAVYAQFVPESGLATFEIMQWGLDAKQASLVDASHVTCPVLCLVGTRDKVNPPATVHISRSVTKNWRRSKNSPITATGWSVNRDGRRSRNMWRIGLKRSATRNGRAPRRANSSSPDRGACGNLS